MYRKPLTESGREVPDPIAPVGLRGGAGEALRHLSEGQGKAIRANLIHPGMLRAVPKLIVQGSCTVDYEQ